MTLTRSTVAAVWSALRGRARPASRLLRRLPRRSIRRRAGRWPGGSRQRIAGRRARLGRAVELAQEQGLDRVHSMSREGAFLARVHEPLVAPILARGIAEPSPAVHLALSRRSHFRAARLRGLDRDSLGRMWSMYGVQSPRALLISPRAQIRTVHEAALARHRLDPAPPARWRSRRRSNSRLLPGRSGGRDQYPSNCCPNAGNCCWTISAKGNSISSLRP